MTGPRARRYSVMKGATLVLVALALLGQSGDGTPMGEPEGIGAERGV